MALPNHLTRVEWPWIDGGMRNAEVDRSEEEFRPGPELTIEAAIAAYRDRADATDAAVRFMSLGTPCRWGESADLRSTRRRDTQVTPTRHGNSSTAPPGNRRPSHRAKPRDRIGARRAPERASECHRTRTGPDPVRRALAVSTTPWRRSSRHVNSRRMVVGRYVTGEPEFLAEAVLRRVGYWPAERRSRPGEPGWRRPCLRHRRDTAPDQRSAAQSGQRP